MLVNLYSEKRTRTSQADLNTILAAHELYVRHEGGRRAMLKLRDMNGLELINRRLDEADFSGASLVGANAYGASFIKANLYCTDLRFCNLRYAKLTGADLRGASFEGGDLVGAVLDYADMRVAIMVHACADGAQRKHQRDGGGTTDGVDFRNASLRCVSFGNAKLAAPNFSGTLLHGARFAGAILTDAKFDGAVLTGVNLSELKVPPEALKTCITDPTPDAVSRSAQLRDEIDAHVHWVETGGVRGRPAVLDGQDLRPLGGFLKKRNLVGISARGVIAVGVDFSGSALQGSKFAGADLRGAHFVGSNLSGASFKAAKLHHARFEKARLGTLQLRSGEALRTSLEQAEAGSAQFSGAVMDGSLGDFGFTAFDEPNSARPHND